jgi:hypothetical protein
LHLYKAEVEMWKHNYNVTWMRIQRMAQKLIELPIYITQQVENELCENAGGDLEGEHQYNSQMVYENGTIQVVADYKGEVESYQEEQTGAHIFTRIDHSIDISAFYNGDNLNTFNADEVGKNILKDILDTNF